MAKKGKKEEKKTEKISPAVANEEKYNLVELVDNAEEDMSWIIYNLSRVGLIGQFEQELQDYGTKNIKPSLTVSEFNDIITGIN